MFDVGSNGGDENNTVYPQDKIVVGAKKEKNAMLISWNKSPISHFVGSGQSNIKSIVLNKSNGDAFRFSLSLFIWLFKKNHSRKKSALGGSEKSLQNKVLLPSQGGCRGKGWAITRDKGKVFHGLENKKKKILAQVLIFPLTCVTLCDLINRT